MGKFVSNDWKAHVTVGIRKDDKGGKNMTMIDDIKAVIWGFKSKMWFSATSFKWCPLWTVILRRMGVFVAHRSGGNGMSHRGCVSFDDLWPSISLLTWGSSFWTRQVSTSVRFRLTWWARFRPDPAHLMNFITRLWLHISNHVMEVSPPPLMF